MSRDRSNELAMISTRKKFPASNGLKEEVIILLYYNKLYCFN